MNLIGLFVFLIWVNLLVISFQLRKIWQELKHANDVQLLNLRDKLKERTDTLQTAIDNQKKAK